MYHILRQNRKTVAISVTEDLKVCIKAPHGVSKEEIEKIISKNDKWIQKAIEEKKKKKENTHWADKEEILYLGEVKKIYFTKSKEAKCSIQFINNTYHISVPDKDDLDVVSELMIKYRKEQSKPIFYALTYKYCQLIGVKCQKITIRQQKTRWGSCSSRGNIAYNVKLLGAPLDVIEYVVLHEVMHLKHFNHSEAFWREIAQVMPHYEQHKLYLKEQQLALEI